MGIVLGAFGPLVRGRVAAAGAKRGLVVSVGKVRPSFQGLVLSDVDVRATAIPALTVKLREVHVRASLGGSLEGVTASGGEVHANGSVATLRAQLDAFEATRPKAEPAGNEPKGAGFPLEAKNLDVYLRAAEDGEIELHGVDVRRAGDQARLAIREAKGTRAGARIEGAGLVVEAKRAEKAWELGSVASQRLALDFPRENAALPQDGGRALDPGRAPAPGPKGDAAAQVTERGLSPRFVERTKAASDRARELARKAIAALPDGAKIQLDGLEVSFVANDKPVHVGPHRLGGRVQRGGV